MLALLTKTKQFFSNRRVSGGHAPKQPDDALQYLSLHSVRLFSQSIAEDPESETAIKFMDADVLRKVFVRLKENNANVVEQFKSQMELIVCGYL